MKCCICGKEYHGFSNNPYGALNEDKKVIEFKPTDRCCDECNRKHVIPGRIYLLNKKMNEVDE